MSTAHKLIAPSASPATEPVYRMYIDEVGNHDLDSSGSTGERYFSLTGFIITIESASSVLKPRLDALKKEFFNPDVDEPLILHRKELLSAKPPFDVLANLGVRSVFDGQLLRLFDSLDFTLVTVVVDKLAHKQKYFGPEDPYKYSLEILVERFVHFLERKGSRGDVVAEARGKKEDMQIRTRYENFFNSGTDFVNSSRVQTRLTSRKLKVKPKDSNIAGLQLCDLLAHPSRQALLCEKGIAQPPSSDSFSSALMKRISARYDQANGKRVGVKFLP